MAIMGIRLEEKADLAAYQLKEVAQICYTQWNEEKRNNNVVL